MTIIGNKFQVEFEMAKAILDFQSDTFLTFTITQKNGEDVSITETVTISITEIRPNLFITTWQEASGTTVTQVQDFENNVVYSNWTSPTGEFINKKGAIKPL